MKQIWILLQREYLQRIKKRSFILMTLLGPLFFVLITIVPVWLASSGTTATKTVQILDKQNWFSPETDTKSYKAILLPVDTEIQQALAGFLQSDDNYLIYINKESGILIYEKTRSAPTLKNWIKERVQQKYLQETGIDPAIINRVLNEPAIRSQNLGGNENSEVLTFLSIFSGVLIYIFIIAYTMQVMRGVVEEKSNRITELLITSVSPYKLMAGKIIGIGLVSITQFLIWLAISAGGLLIFNARYGESLKLFNNANIEKTLTLKGIDTTEALQWNSVISSFETVDLATMCGLFLFFFISGYLLYSSLFAAVGAAVESETETQQYSFPLTLPIFICFTAFEELINNPDSTLSWFFSLFPFTSPVAVMILYPAGLSTDRILLSMGVLLVSLLLMIWISGRIYRTAILMYGKKASLRELLKWSLK